MEDDSTTTNFARETSRLWRAWRTVHEMVQDRVCHPATAARLSDRI